MSLRQDRQNHLNARVQMVFSIQRNRATPIISDYSSDDTPMIVVILSIGNLYNMNITMKSQYYCIKIINLSYCKIFLSP